MANFPTLSLPPVYPIAEAREDALIVSAAEGGYLQTRPRFTRTRRTFELTYRNLSAADKSTLDGFYVGDGAFGSAIVTWTHPETSTAYSVRMIAPVQYTLAIPGRYDAVVVLQEA